MHPLSAACLESADVLLASGGEVQFCLGKPQTPRVGRLELNRVVSPPPLCLGNSSTTCTASLEDLGGVFSGYFSRQLEQLLQFRGDVLQWPAHSSRG